MYCPNCKKEVEEDALFCPECGTKTVAVVRCHVCGQPLEENMAFCPECGTPVGETIEHQQTGYSRTQRETGQEMGSGMPQNFSQGNWQQTPPPQGTREQGMSGHPQKSSSYRPEPPKKKVPIAAIAGICAGIVVIGVGAFFFLHGKDEAAKQEAQTAQSQTAEDTDSKTEEKEAKETPEATPAESQAPDKNDDSVVSVIGGGSQEEKQEEEQPEAKQEEAPATFVGAKNKEDQQKVLTTGSQLDLQHMGNLLGNAGATYGTYVLDITNMQEYDGGNADEPLPASALIGVPILFTIADGVDKGNINLDTPVTLNYTFENGRGVFKSGDNGRSFPVSQMLSEALLNSDNNALNSLMDFLTLEKINETCHSYGFSSVDMQRKLMSGSSNLENYISAKDAAMMLNAIYQDNFVGIGKAFLENNFKISGSDTANRGMYPACTSCGTFLNLNGITDTRYNEIGLIQNGDEVFILSVFTCNGVGTTSASALTTLTSYVVSTLLAA